jgi:uncharacterized delta-60 repeat protein
MKQIPAKWRSRREREPVCYLEHLEQRSLLSSGSLDVVLAATGQLPTDFNLGNDAAHAVAVQQDSKIVVIGENDQTDSSFALARYNLNGTLDSSFGTGGKVTTLLSASQNGVARGVVIQPDGKIVVAGYAGAGSHHLFALARYQPSGSLDSSFGTGGKVTTDLGNNALANSVALTADGHIVVAGSLDETGPTSDSLFAVVRYNSDGSLDTTFNSTGIVTTKFGTVNAAANKVLVQPDGRIVAAA